MNENNQNKIIIEKALSDSAFRQELVKDSLYWFILIYLPDYIKHPFAEFHKEMIHILQELEDNVVISAFRGSGKSTIVSLAFLIWSMIGNKKKRFIVICSNTNRQAEILMFNVKNLLESHSLLKADLGPFSELSEEWNVNSLVFKQYDTKIMTISVNESIRGIRYKHVRPDLIILDDVETLETVRTEENREKLINWFERDIVPLGDDRTSIIVVGTIMTQGSLIATLSERMRDGSFEGVFKRYPILSKSKKITWPERWKSQSELRKFRKKLGILNRTWETEYLLNDYVEEDQIVKPEMIKYYDELPFGSAHLLGGFVGVDLAISLKETAAKTAILSGYAFKINGKPKLYLLPHPFNKRVNFSNTISKIKQIVDGMKTGSNTYIFVETVGYQKSVQETLLKEGYSRAKPFEVRGEDKQARLETTLYNLTQKNILFPKKGCEELITQLVRFRFEKFKDLADAFSIICIKAFEELDKGPGVIAVDATGLMDSIWNSRDMDWGEREDREIFRKYKFGETHRIVEFRD